MSAMEAADQYERRFSHDSQESRDSVHSSILDFPEREKHDSLPFVLDPIDLSLDPIRFSFFGDLSSGVGSSKQADSPKHLSLELAANAPPRPDDTQPNAPVRGAPLAPFLLEPFSFDLPSSSKPDLSKNNIQDEERTQEQEEESVQETGAEDKSGSATTTTANMEGLAVPRHPIPSMQGAFAESMVEAAGKTRQEKQKPTLEHAIERRNQLLVQKESEPTYAARWKQKPGQMFHELWKLIAQISFGSYLLFDGIAKNDADVLNILQGHVDEVDEFLESTLHDFDHAKTDIDERLRCLKIPMENVDVFDQMLTDRAFRTQIVTGNEQIEHVIKRSAAAMNDALRDVQQGLSATKEFAVWLSEVQRDPEWTYDRPDMQRVYDAMKGNAEGWYKAFVSLQSKGNNLGIVLVQLGSIVAEMDKRAGEVSRQMRFSSDARAAPTTLASPPQSPHRRKVSHASQPSMASFNSNKELPSENMITPAIQATLPAFAYVADREQTPESETDMDSGPEMEYEEEPEPVLQPTVFTLQPRVYSPLPSPSKLSDSPPWRQEAPPAPKIPDTPPTVVKERTSLRQRFSMKRKKNVPPALPPPETSPPLQLQQTLPERRAPSPRQQSPPERYNPSPLHQNPTVKPSYRNESFSSNTSPRQPSMVSFQQPQVAPSPRQSSLYAPRHTSSSSQRIPSAILTFPQPNSPHASYHNNTGAFGGYPAADDPQLIPSQLPTPAGSQSLNESYFPAPPSVSSPFISSPRSDQLHFRPVNADPNSPLQRPWTAAPEGHNHHNVRHSHSNHNLRHHASNSGLGIQGAQLRDPNTLSTNRGASAMNRTTMAPSMMSEGGMSSYTVGVDDQGKKIKKKKSGFGWLKKAFSLSEEERLAFEERRRRTEMDRDRAYGYGGDGYGREAPRFLDGKRIR